MSIRYSFHGRRFCTARSTIAVRYVNSEFLGLPLNICISGIHGLNVLLQSVLDVASADSLPSFNDVKTYAFTLKLLGMMNLPDAVLMRHRELIVGVLKRALRGSMRQTAHCFPHAEAIDAVSNLLDNRPRVFLPVFKDLVPILYAYLTHKSQDMRLIGCKALSSFAKAIQATSVSMKLRFDYSQEAANIIDRDITRSRQTDVMSLRKSFNVSRDSATYTTDAAFALVTISSLIILSGPLIFTRPNSLKILITPFENAKALRTSCNSKILTTVWRCLTWALSKLHEWGVTETHPEIEEQAYQVVRQEGGRDLNVALVASLLSLREVTEPSLGLALDLLTSMVGKDSIVRTAGIEMLHILLYGHEDGSTDLDEHLIPNELFDRHILDSRASRVKQLIEKLPIVETTIVHPILESDVLDHWDTILRIWNLAVEAEMHSRAAIIYVCN